MYVGMYLCILLSVPKYVFKKDQTVVSKKKSSHRRPQYPSIEDQRVLIWENMCLLKEVLKNRRLEGFLIEELKIVSQQSISPALKEESARGLAREEQSAFLINTAQSNIL